jgi:hypothetical protein
VAAIPTVQPAPPGGRAAGALWLLLVYFRQYDWGGLAVWGYYCVYYVWVVAPALTLRRMGTPR